METGFPTGFENEAASGGDRGGGRQTAAVFYRDRHALTVSFVTIDPAEGLSPTPMPPRREGRGLCRRSEKVVENFRRGTEKKGTGFECAKGVTFEVISAPIASFYWQENSSKLMPFPRRPLMMLFILR